MSKGTKELIIKFEPFVFKQTVFAKMEDGTIIKEQVPQKELASFISLLDNVSKIHFFGNESYAMKIKEECITKYNLKENIVIEINK